MFYRRKYYLVKNEFVEVFNNHFTETNLPNQLKHGARLIGRWMPPFNEDSTEVFAIWEYDSYEKYQEIETKIKLDAAHIHRIKQWYETHGGREYVYKNYVHEVKNEVLQSTI
ncbi:NIPSNAP family protein [Niallia sp. JL1B1071]|uniref:NIPSNAP family protein n=1 Tax=Niallia tiangongensis TaxID=3237105 RepID=UPI0037DD95C7